LDLRDGGPGRASVTGLPPRVYRPGDSGLASMTESTFTPLSFGPSGLVPGSLFTFKMPTVMPRAARVVGGMSVSGLEVPSALPSAEDLTVVVGHTASISSSSSGTAFGHPSMSVSGTVGMTMQKTQMEFPMTVSGLPRGRLQDAGSSHLAPFTQ